MSENHIAINFDDIQEAQPVSGGRYDLTIVEAKVAQTGPQSKVPGSPQYRVSIALPLEYNAPNITHFVSLPAGPDDDNADFKALLLKRFLTLFRVPHDNNGIDVERLAMEMVGCTANAEVKLDEPDANGNVYNRLVVPRLPVEGSRR